MSFLAKAVRSVSQGISKAFRGEEMANEDSRFHRANKPPTALVLNEEKSSGFTVVTEREVKLRDLSVE